MSTSFEQRPYCGDPVKSLAHLIKVDPTGGIPALFDGRRANFTYNTRVAIRAACTLMRLEPGAQILAPSYNCGSEVDPLIDAGLSVRLYPVEPDASVDPSVLESCLSPETKAIYLIHYFGIPQPHLAEIRQICDVKRIRLIEDCALSLLSGSVEDAERTTHGRAGDVSVFCFHKFFPTESGGVLVVNADDLPDPSPFDRAPSLKRAVKYLIRAGMETTLGAKRCQALIRELRNRRSNKEGGMAISRPEGAGTLLPDTPADYYFNRHLQGMRISFFAARPARALNPQDARRIRRAHWERYATRLKNVAGIRLFAKHLPENACPVCFPIFVENRDEVACILQCQGISASAWWAGYNRNLDWSGQENALVLKDSILALPLHQDLTEEAIDAIANAVIAEVAR